MEKMQQQHEAIRPLVPTTFIINHSQQLPAWEFYYCLASNEMYLIPSQGFISLQFYFYFFPTQPFISLSAQGDIFGISFLSKTIFPCLPRVKNGVGMMTPVRVHQIEGGHMTNFLKWTKKGRQIL